MSKVLINTESSYEKVRFYYTSKLPNMVTGCTDGIGKAYTEELAKRGLKKFILISRNEEKLDDLSKHLSSKYGVEIRICKFDFTETEYANLAQFLGNFEEIGILVNNVGMAPKQLQKFSDQPVGLAEDILRVNAFSVVKMCELVLPKMLKRNQGIIVNIASIQGWRPIPLLSTYSCSKAFVSFLSECLSREYNSKTIHIQCLLPLVVATKMSQYDEKAADGFQIVTPETYARQAVDIIGNHPMSSGCIAHEFQCAGLAFFPYWILKYLIEPIYAYQRQRLAKLAKAENVKLTCS